MDCQWSEWKISPCSATCGRGNRKKIRTKIVEDNNWGTCSGEDMETEYCNLKECIGSVNF